MHLDPPTHGLVSLRFNLLMQSTDLYIQTNMHKWENALHCMRRGHYIVLTAQQFKTETTKRICMKIHANSDTRDDIGIK